MTLHAHALRVLETWPASSGEQEQLRTRFVDHLREHPDGVTRGCFPEHVTAGVLVVDPDRTHVLLNLHAKAKAWFAFGGHCEDTDATLAGVALREGLEESGLTDLRIDPTPLDLDAHEVAFCDPRGTVTHLDVRFLAVATGGRTPVASEESLDVAWWPVARLPTREVSMLRMVDLATQLPQDVDRDKQRRRADLA